MLEDNELPMLQEKIHMLEDNEITMLQKQVKEIPKLRERIRMLEDNEITMLQEKIHMLEDNEMPKLQEKIQTLEDESKKIRGVTMKKLFASARELINLGMHEDAIIDKTLKAYNQKKSLIK